MKALQFGDDDIDDVEHLELEMMQLGVEIIQSVEDVDMLPLLRVFDETKYANSLQDALDNGVPSVVRTQNVAPGTAMGGAFFFWIRSSSNVGARNGRIGACVPPRQRAATHTPGAKICSVSHLMCSSISSSVGSLSE